jgi:hypothetical protein
MAARKPVQLSEQALMRILKAAIQEERIKAIKDKRILKAMLEGRGRRKLHGWPADQKLSDLRLELLKAISLYSFLRDSRAEAEVELARLKAIHKHASALANELATDEENGGMFTEHWPEHWPEDMPAASNLVNKMREVVKQSGWLEASPQNIAAETRAAYGAADISALDWLVGARLPAIYENFFREPATAYREGPYLDFALQVLAEFEIKNDGQPYSRETIITALTRTRSGRSRRRHHGGQK